MDEENDRQGEPDDMDKFLKNHIAHLTVIMATEPDDMKRLILQARIDNMRRAQQLWAGQKADPGHA